jgi:NADH:ubiquinone oxidoreductase subunit F (NADH-binding)
MGTKESPGTKVFSLSGQIVHSGLIEVALGTPLREVILDIGGGVPEGHTLKAVQTGGPSGGCIPASHLDVPVAYEALAPLGSIVGSGGMIVLDDTSCMVDVARYFMDFCMRESCGKCIPCRAGTVQATRLLERMTHGQGTSADLAQLEALCAYMKDASLCGLGQNAPNPIFSTLRHFRDEYVAHVQDKVCPAGVCSMSPESNVPSLAKRPLGTRDLGLGTRSEVPA